MNQLTIPSDEDESVARIVANLSLGSVGSLAQDEVMQLGMIISEYQSVIPNITPEYNAQIRSEVAELKPTIENALLALVTWQKAHVDVDSESRMFTAVTNRAVQLQIVLAYLERFETETKMDALTGFVSQGIVSLFEQMGSMNDSIRNKVDTSVVDAESWEEATEPEHVKKSLGELLSGKSTKIEGIQFFVTDGNEPNSKEEEIE